MPTTLPIGLLIYQLDGAGDTPTLRVRSGNRGASRLLGFDVDEAVRAAVADVFPAVTADLLHRYARVATSGQVEDFGVYRYGDARVAER